MLGNAVKNERRKLSVAPMMGWTDRHCRFFLRCISPSAWLYTEMVTSDAIIHGDRDKLLGFDACEHPVVLQLGGSDPVRLAQAAQIGEEWGYDEINLNIGCPSDRVQSGCFGAAMMADPVLTARCVKAMSAAVSIPVTVKCRIGIDDQDSEKDLDLFIDHVVDAGCRHFIIHARKAWLQGLSPKENRDIPPLNYDRVYRLKARLPQLDIAINGGIQTPQEVEEHLAHVDEVMIGREAYQNPYVLAEIDQVLQGAPSRPTRFDILEAFLPYVEQQLQRGVRLHQMVRHILGLFAGEAGGRHFRRILSENSNKPGAGGELIVEAMNAVRKIQDRKNESLHAARLSA